MNDPWLPILEKLTLSRAEQAAVRRFEHDPMGRGFLPVADILRAHRRVDEGLELLAQGVERHPTFTVARVVLARELLTRGLVLQSWQTLEDSPQDLDDNVLAQKLRFRLAILLFKSDLAKSIHRHMANHQMLDKETAAYGEMLSLSSAEKARERLIMDYRADGTELILPAADELRHEELAPQRDTAAEDPFGEDPEPGPEHLKTYHVMPLNEVFHGAEAGIPSATAGGLELDSTTLAELYCKQGHYSKALAIFRRLLRMTPNSDYLRRMIKDTVLLEKEQRADDLTVDPSVVDQMEALEILDVQKKLFDGLLERLNRQDD